MAVNKNRKNNLVPTILNPSRRNNTASSENKEDVNPDRLPRILYEKQNVIDFLKAENEELTKKVDNQDFIIANFTHCVTGKDFQERLKKVYWLANKVADERQAIKDVAQIEAFDKAVKLNYLSHLAVKYAEQQSLLKMELSDARRDVSILNNYKEKYSELLKYYHLTHSLPEVKQVLDEKGESLHLDVDWINSAEKKDDPIDEFTRKELQRATFWRVIAVLVVILLSVLVATLLIPAIGKLHIGEWIYNILNNLGKL